MRWRSIWFLQRGGNPGSRPAVRGAVTFCYQQCWPSHNGLASTQRGRIGASNIYLALSCVPQKGKAWPPPDSTFCCFCGLPCSIWPDMLAICIQCVFDQASTIKAKASISALKIGRRKQGEMSDRRRLLYRLGKAQQTTSHGAIKS